MRLFFGYQNFLKLWGSASRLILKAKAPLPRVCYLLLTTKCNLSCRMCFFECADRKNELGSISQSALTAQEWLKITSFLPRLCAFSLTGGEPLLYPDFYSLFKVIGALKPISLETNGTLIDEKAAETLLSLTFTSLTFTGLAVISISIYGPQEIHNKIAGSTNAFERTIEGIRHLVRIRGDKRLPRISIRTVILPENAEVLGKMPLLVKKLGADELIFSHQSTSNEIMNFKDETKLDFISGLPEQINGEILRNSLNEAFKSSPVPVTINPNFSINETISLYQGQYNANAFDCLFPWTKIIISPYGDIGICPMVWIGNVNEYPVKEIWNGKQAQDLRNLILNRSTLPLACAGCCNIISRHRN